MRAVAPHSFGTCAQRTPPSNHRPRPAKPPSKSPIHVVTAGIHLAVEATRTATDPQLIWGPRETWDVIAYFAGTASHPRTTHLLQRTPPSNHRPRPAKPPSKSPNPWGTARECAQGVTRSSSPSTQSRRSPARSLLHYPQAAPRPATDRALLSNSHRSRPRQLRCSIPFESSRRRPLC